MIYTPQDHKNLIYSFLDIHSLNHLRACCQTFYTDYNLVLILVQKIVDSYFYKSYNYTGIIRRWDNFGYEKIFYEMYTKKLKQISFTDIQILSMKDNHAERMMYNNQIKEYPATIDLVISFFTGFIITLPRKDKFEIIDKMVEYLYDLWKYAEDNRQALHVHFHSDCQYNQKCPCFDFYNLYHLNIHDSLIEIFSDDNDFETRKYIIHKLNDLSYRTRDGKTHAHIWNLSSNQYKIKDFMTSPEHIRYDEISKIIDIGEMLYKMDRIDLLEDFFSSYFDSFINYIDDNPSCDKYAFDINLQLKFNQRSGVKDEKRLQNLMDVIDPNLFNEFQHALLFRSKREGRKRISYGSDMEEEI